MVGVPVIKVITGQRRSGKSYLLQSIIERYDPTHVLYIDYELKKNDPYILDHVLYTYITDSMPDKQILAIDEIQKCRGWEHILLSLLKEYPLLEIWITGSNSSMLANDLTTHIRGRYLTIHVLPFSFEEYCQYFLVEKNSDSFVSYIDFGGFPGLYSSKDTPDIWQERSQTIIDTIFIKDIIERYTIKHTGLLTELFAYIVSTIANIFSYDAFQVLMKRTYGSETTYLTIQQYLEYLAEVYMIYPVEIFDIQGKNIIQRQRKRYISDHSWRKILFSHFDPGQGKELENIVFLECIRQGWKVFVGRFGTKEVDFIIEKGKERIYIQVAYLLASEEVIHREFSVLESIDDNFPKYVITMDPIIYHNPKNIKHIRMREMQKIFGE